MERDTMFMDRKIQYYKVVTAFQIDRSLRLAMNMARTVFNKLSLLTNENLIYKSLSETNGH